MEEVPQPPTSDDEWFALELVGSDSLFLDVNSKLGSILVGEKSSEASQVIIDKTRTVYWALYPAEARQVPITSRRGDGGFWSHGIFPFTTSENASRPSGWPLTPEAIRCAV